MVISRPSSEEIISRAAATPLHGQTQITVDQGDSCVVQFHGQVLGKIDPGHWMVQQLPFAQQLLAGQGAGAELLYVFTRPFGPLKVGGRAAGGRFFAETSVAIYDPVRYVTDVVGTGPEDGSRWITSTVGGELSRAVEQAAQSTPLEQLSSALGEITQTVAAGVGSKLHGVGVTFGQVMSLNVVGAGGGAPAGGGGSAAAPGAAIAATGEGRLQLLGSLAGKVTQDSPDSDIAKYEKFGLFVAADPVAIRHFSGAEPGWRWMARGAGHGMGQVRGWPLAPNGTTCDYFPTEEQARAYYGALRNHVLSSVPGITPQDTRENFGLNVPTAYAETMWSNGQEFMRLLYDRMEDMNALAHETDGAIGIHPACPPDQPDLPIITYKSASDIHHVAVGKGPTGAADHVVIVFSKDQKPEPTISEGMPRAEWMSKFEKAALQFTGNILVVQWGRFSGNDVLGDASADPVAALTAKLGSNIAVPLQTSHDASSRLGGHAPGYAVRMEPGGYSINYYEMTTKQHGEFSFLAISRDGAESFLPTDVVGDAGGIVLGGLSVEQYAMLSVERDNLLMTQGGQACTSPQMEAICQRYGVPFSNDGRAGRVYEWEEYLTNDPAFSAQWATQRGIATMRLQGQEPNEEQIKAIAQQQNQAQASLEQHSAQLDDIRDVAIQVIQASANRSPEDLLGLVAQHYPQMDAETVLHKTLRILREPEEYGRFNDIEACVEPLARAHYRTMSAEDQKFEGSEDKFFKEERETVYSAYDIEVPGFFSKLFG